jgi:hypothetical protein
MFACKCGDTIFCRGIYENVTWAVDGGMADFNLTIGT